uniref:LOW QUALITY PROTEIN: leucine-rich repeat-containing protein 37A-like n=1 Tax=Phascolarctos cinereus TaxID=38626 RepID=A0A6P5L9C6_PHACI|nr:LOW QUALITY PROTEIN: leucine-rich repeat-containing protein 37A-like [Phascolarctos cinereus]
MARAQAVPPDPASVRASVLDLGEVFTKAPVLARALAVLLKVSDVLASPKPTPTPDTEPTPIYLVKRVKSLVLTPVAATRAPILPSELFQTRPPAILMPLSALTASQTWPLSSSVPAPAPLVPRTSALVPAPAPTAPQASAASLVPTLTSTLSQILVSSQIPATSLEGAKASKSTRTLAASLVPAQTLMSFPVSSLVPTQTLTSSPEFLSESLRPTQTSQLIQILHPSLEPVQTSVSFLPQATPTKHSPATPTLFPVLPYNLAVNMIPTQVFKPFQTSAVHVMHTAMPAQTPASSPTLAPTLKHTQIPPPLLQLPQTLPLSLVSGEAPNQLLQALVPTQTLAPPPVPQEQYQFLTSGEILPWTLPPPPESTKLYSPSPELTKDLVSPQELKQVPVSVLSSKSSQTPTMLLNNTFPWPSVLKVHTTIPSSLVSQKSIWEIDSVCLGPCTCKAGTLSCTGLSPDLRLHSVPLPGPKAHNLTFFFLDFHGNSISIIEKGIWKSYPWAKTLNLKDNALHKLHKNSFEGLLSLQYLDLSCNKIHVIERQAFEPLPFLQFLNLSCNSLKKLSYGTFQAWHGMQFLQKLMLSHNPLSAIEDKFFFQLPSLKYLDIGRTEVPLVAVKNILMMALRLQTLILPSHIGCCLCQFENNIESTFKTIKLHCGSKCFTNSLLCDQKESIDHIQEEFMNTFQSRKNNTSTELNLHPERACIDSDTLNLINEQLSSYGETGLLDAAKYLLPKLLRGQVKNVELKLLPFIELLNAQLQNREKTSDPSMTKTSWSSFGPMRINFTDEIELKKLCFVTNLLEAYLREKMYYKNKHEKIVKAKYPTLQKKWKTFLLEKNRKCSEVPGKCSQPPASSSRKAVAPGMDTCKGRFCEKTELREVGKVSSNRKSVKKKHSEGTDQESIQGNSQSVKSSLENIARGRTRASGQATRRLRKPSCHHGGISSSPSPLAASVEDRSKPGGLKYPFSASKNVNKRLKYQGQKEKQEFGTTFQKDHIPVIDSNKNHLFYKAKPHSQYIPEAKENQKMKNKLSQNRWLLENPVFTEMRSLINNPSKKIISFSPERSISTEASKMTSPEKASPERPLTRSTTLENTATSPLGNSLPAVQQTNKTHGKDQGNTKSLRKPNDNSFFWSASADSFEIELNRQLEHLIPNSAMRSLVSHVVRTLEKDCSEPEVQLTCAKLISRASLLMKRLSEQEKRKESTAYHNSDPWKYQADLNDNTTLQKVLDQLQIDELKEDIPEFGYNNKLLLAISVTVVVMIIIAVICLIEICSHRPRTSKGEIKYLHNLRNFITSLHKKSSGKSHKEDGNFYRKRKPLWLRDMYQPLDATRKKNMAQKLRDQDSSDEDEIFNKEGRNEIIGKKEEKGKK